MKQEFELIQSSIGKSLLVWLGGLPLVTAVAIGGPFWLLAGASKNLQLAWIGVIFPGGIYLLYRLGKAVSAVPTRVTVAADRLTIYKLRSSEETQVPFTQLAAYRASRLNGAQVLRLTLKDDRKLQVRINSQLYSGQDFDGMVVAFEAAVGHFQQGAGPAAAVRQERTFFEKPVSTLLLVLFTAFLVWAGWVVTTGPRPVTGNVFVCLGSYLTYLVSWYTARGRRNQPDGQG